MSTAASSCGPERPPVAQLSQLFLLLAAWLKRDQPLEQLQVVLHQGPDEQEVEPVDGNLCKTRTAAAAAAPGQREPAAARRYCFPQKARPPYLQDWESQRPSTAQSRWKDQLKKQQTA